MASAARQLIGMLYGKLIKELAKLGYDVESKLSEDTLFLFDNFPELKQLKQEAAEAAKQQRELFGAGDSFGADDE